MTREEIARIIEQVAHDAANGVGHTTVAQWHRMVAEATDAILALAKGADVPEEATGANAVIRGGLIAISIEIDALPVIVNGSCCCDALYGLWKVTDAAVFAEEVCRSLNDEDEQGTTLVHKMFDAGFRGAIDQGAEGIEAATEEEFEELSASFQAPPLPPPPLQKEGER